MKTIFLFDMDGVLIQSKGYYFSLQSVIKLLGKNLGIENAELGMDEISRLEAIGIYHIWDHLTFFTIQLLLQCWKDDPGARIPGQLESEPITENQSIQVDFNNCVPQLHSDHSYSLYELGELILIREGQLTSAQRVYLSLLLESSRDIYRSPILPFMQEFVLGSQVFQKTYELESQLGLESYSQKYDKPSLSSKNHRLLQRWLKSQDHLAAIFTSRPNLPPEKEFFGTPEAEIGSRITGLSFLPIIGAGSLDWLAEKEGSPPRTYNKPHPVHALAAIQAAEGFSIDQALQRAVMLADPDKSHRVGDEWHVFKNATIYAIEDSVGGLISAKKASEIMRKNGIPNQMNLIGIGEQSDKTRALSSITDQLYPDINNCPLVEIISR